MDSAIRARQLYRRLVLVDPATDEAYPVAEPDLSGLPDWVAEACREKTLFVSDVDDYAAVWVDTPYGVGELGVFVRCAMGSLLLERAKGYVAVLAEISWTFVEEE